MSSKAKEIKAPLIDIETQEKKGVKQRLSELYKKYGFLGYAALVPAAIFFLIYVARGIHPFGNGTVLVLDLNGQYAYFFEYLREAVTTGDLSLLYSWERALGGEMMGLYAYYLASPLSYIVCLFPKENLQDALFVMFLIKSSLCGVTMGYYLTKIMPKAKKINIIAFSTYKCPCHCIELNIRSKIYISLFVISFSFYAILI